MDFKDFKLKGTNERKEEFFKEVYVLKVNIMSSSE